MSHPVTQAVFDLAAKYRAEHDLPLRAVFIHLDDYRPLVEHINLFGIDKREVDTAYNMGLPVLPPDDPQNWPLRPTGFFVDGYRVQLYWGLSTPIVTPWFLTGNGGANITLHVPIHYPHTPIIPIPSFDWRL